MQFARWIFNAEARRKWRGAERSRKEIIPYKKWDQEQDGSALMTGRHEFQNGVTHTILERERLTLKATTLAQAMKTRGYATGIFGKWHLGDEPDRWPTKRGFDEMLIHGAGGIGQTYPGSGGDAPGNMYQNPALLHNGKFEKTEGYCTDVFFSHAIEWMDEKLGCGRWTPRNLRKARSGQIRMRASARTGSSRTRKTGAVRKSETQP